MSSFEFRDAVRQEVQLLILLAGGTGAGKTESAMRLATGLSGGQPFAVIDTERGRALHKADDYSFKHCPFEEPFTPERYVEAFTAADDLGFPVIVVDSGSHEWEGTGGVLEIQDEEFRRLGSRESVNMIAWNVAKTRHKKWRNALLRARAHVIVCHRAEDKIELGKDDKGKTVVRPKESLTGLGGWIPICEKRLPFEATISLLFTADAPGVPKPIKLERRHQGLVRLDRQVDEETGKQLAAWAAGTGASSPEPRSSALAAAKQELEARKEELEAVHQRISDEGSSFQPPASAVDLAGQARPPVGVAGVSESAGQFTLDEILARGDKGVAWLTWALEQDGWPDEFEANLRLFVQAKLGTPVPA